MKPQSMLQLHVTVHQRLAWIAGHKVHRHSVQGHDVHRIFYKTTELLFADLNYLEAVTMQMNWILVAAQFVPEYVSSVRSSLSF